MWKRQNFVKCTRPCRALFHYVTKICKTLTSLYLHLVCCKIFDFKLCEWWCSSFYILWSLYLSTRFARASSYVADFNTRNKLLTQKLLIQGYRYHKLRKTFSKFYRRYFDLISKFQVGLKSLLRQGLTEPDFYGGLVYKLKKIVGSYKY